MRLWSSAPKPSALATSRARWRALTMSDSPWIVRRTSATGGVAMAIPTGDQPVQQGQPLVGIQRRADAFQLEPELDQRDRDRGLDPDDDRVRTEQPRTDGDLVQQTAEERVDRFD